MRFDAQALMEAQRRAYNFLAKKDSTMPDGTVVPNKYYTPESSITESAQIIQEIPFNNQSSSFIFDYSSNAPARTNVLGNVNLGKTQVFVIYAIQLLLGQGANANTRIYRSRGVTSNDDGIYNSTTSMKIESSTMIDNLNGHNYRDVATNADEFWAEAGMTLINPLRVVNGEIGIFNVTITLLNSLSGVVITPNMFLSMRLHGALGQAQGASQR